MSLDVINDNIYLGAYADVAAAVTAGCTAILNVAAALDYSPPAGIEYSKVGWLDNGTDPCKTYKAAIDALNGLIAQGHIVLVHCVVGANRGPTCVALYYHEYYDYTWTEALAFVEAKHADSSPWPELLATVEACFPDEAADSSCLGVSCTCANAGETGALTDDPVARTVYTNTEQCATASCPDGYSGTAQTVCKDAGTYSSYVSVAHANQLAYAGALDAAAALLVCTDDNGRWRNDLLEH